MSILAEMMDRLSGITSLKERVTELNGQLGDIRRVVVEQQKDIAELKGQLKAILTIQAQASRR